MAIIKISDLAKDMGLSTEIVISVLRSLGHSEVKAHNSTVDDSVKQQIKDKMNEGKEKAKLNFATTNRRAERRNDTPSAPQSAKPSGGQNPQNRPENAERKFSRPVNANDFKGFGGNRLSPDRDTRSGGFNRDGQRPPYQGNREGGGYQNRDGQRQFPPRDRNFGGGFNRDGQRPPYQGNREGGGYQNRDGQRPPYQGGNGGGFNRDGQRPPYQGNRDGFRPRDDRPGGQYGGGYQNRSESSSVNPALAKELAEKQAALQNSEENKHKKKGGKKHLSAKEKLEKHREEEFEMKSNVRKTMAQVGGGNTKKKYKKIRNEETGEEIESNILQVSEFISVSEFAKMVEEDVSTIIAKCMNDLKIFVTINQRLDFPTIQLLAEEFGYEAQLLEEFEENEEENEEENNYELIPRPPVVTVMGHVDHGKTSLLDYIRRTNVVSGEQGGITQHIAAYSVKTKHGDVTFLDTPGHEAFAAMRARGSQITDVVVLVVAADSAVMPQTKEAIDHAKAAGVPIVVAINKIDLPTANPDKIKGELASYGVLVESYGGQIQSVDISAKKGIGVDDLLELLALETGMLDLKAPLEGQAKGVVIESELDKGKGALATVLIMSGTLKKGDVFYTGIYSGKVREMLNEHGQKVKEVKPGYPAIILGLSGTPQAGDNFRVCKTDKEAREIAGKRRLAEKERELRNMQNVVSLANLSQKIKDGKILSLNIILRGDVDGSVEALAGELQKLSTDEIKVNIVLKGVGGIKETDIMLAQASGAIIIGFNINPNPKIKASATNAGVEIKTFRIIYEAIDQVKSAMIGMLAPDIKEEIIGQVEIREVFKIPKIGMVAGSYVLEGKIERNAMARLIRDDVEIADTKVDTLQRFKDQVKEVAAGFDCGLTLAKISDYKVGDRIEVYKEIEIKRKSLERSPNGND